MHLFTSNLLFLPQINILPVMSSLFLSEEIQQNVGLCQSVLPHQWGGLALKIVNRSYSQQ